MVRLLGTCACLALSTACVTMPESYAPPVQRKPALSTEIPHNLRQILRMSEAETDGYIVQDIPKGDRGLWRWTGARPTVRLYLASTANYKFHVDYSIADATLKQTGPVTLRFLVNEKLLTEQRHEKPGNAVFEKPIPEQMLKPNADNDLAIEIDKMFIAEVDGAKLGFILTAIGFRR